MNSFEGLEPLYPRPLSGAKVPDLPPALVPARVPIKGRYVTLEPLDARRHAAELFEAGHTGEGASRIWDYVNYGPWPDVESYAATLREQSASFDPIFYAIRSRESGKATGQASFLDIHPQNGVIEIAHVWFAPELQRTRAATEALFLLLRHAMDELGYRRMQWRCNALNTKSREAARRLGFRFEGIFYNHLIFKGMNRDTAWYSILDDEWPEVRRIIERWLGAANFAEDGRQVASLSELMGDRSPARSPKRGAAG